MRAESLVQVSLSSKLFGMRILLSTHRVALFVDRTGPRRQSRLGFIVELGTPAALLGRVGELLRKKLGRCSLDA